MERGIWVSSIEPLPTNSYIHPLGQGPRHSLGGSRPVCGKFRLPKRGDYDAVLRCCYAHDRMAMLNIPNPVFQSPQLRKPDLLLERMTQFCPVRGDDFFSHAFAIDSSIGDADPANGGGRATQGRHSASDFCMDVFLPVASIITATLGDALPSCWRMCGLIGHRKVARQRGQGPVEWDLTTSQRHQTA